MTESFHRTASGRRAAKESRTHTDAHTNRKNDLQKEHETSRYLKRRAGRKRKRGAPGGRWRRRGVHWVVREDEGDGERRAQPSAGAAAAAPLSIPHHARGAWASLFLWRATSSSPLAGQMAWLATSGRCPLDEVRFAQPVSPSRSRVSTGPCEARAGSKQQAHSRTVLSSLFILTLFIFI
jgi:hypothetical protein